MPVVGNGYTVHRQTPQKGDAWQCWCSGPTVGRMNKLAVSATHLSSLAVSWQGLGGTLLLLPSSLGTLFGSPTSPGIPGLLVLTLLGPMALSFSG